MRKGMLLFGLSLALTLIATTPQVMGQVLGQPYRISDKEVTELLDRIAKETGTFRKSLKDALNRSRIDRSRREDDINSYVKNFEEQTKRLDDNFDHHKSTTADGDSVLDRAARIDGFMFDAETLINARKFGLTVREFPVEWRADPDSRYKPFSGSFRNLFELVRIQLQ